MDLILTVRSDDPQAPLAELLTAPLGLDVWEVKPEYLVLSANENQAERLRAMGYSVTQDRSTESFLAEFAPAEAETTGYHSAESLEQDLRQLAESAPEVAEL